MADTRQKQRLEARLAELRQSQQEHADKADEQGVQGCQPRLTLLYGTVVETDLDTLLVGLVGVSLSGLS